MMRPTCTVCGSNLEHTSEGWRCPVDGFFYLVSRGVAGEPLLSPLRQLETSASVGAGESQQAKEETFEGWLEEHGVTKEMFRDADNKTKEELKVAFYQRGKKDADAILLPPQK